MCLLDILFGSTKKALQQCENERNQLSADAELYASQLIACRDELKRLQKLCDGYITSIEENCSELVKLKQMLTDAVTIPNITPQNGVNVYPFTMTQDMWHRVTPVTISDTEYLAFTEDEWLNILTPCQAEVKRVLGFPKSEVSDCENWTNALIFLVQEVFRRGGYPLQGAFMKLLSKKHSYCGFMLPDYSIKVYEPMNGRVVGNLGETGAGNWGEDTYHTEQAFFLT